MVTKFKVKRRENVAKESPARKKVGIVFGGKSSEHHISCLTASSVLGAIDRDKYDVFAIGITKSGTWLRVSSNPKKWEQNGKKLPEVKEPLVKARKSKPITLTAKFDALGLDVVFPLLHGAYGEDGTLQGMLEMLGVRYVGCGVFASAACQDKHFTKVLCQAVGIKVAPWLTLRVNSSKFELSAKELDKVSELSNNFKKPLFVKPSRAGSSVGVTMVTDKAKLRSAILKASKEDSKVLIEAGISGRELECAILGSVNNAKPSAIGEIVIKNGFYDYKTKYENSSAKLLVDPPMDTENRKRLQATALKAFQAVDGEGLARVDMFLTSKGEIYLNEINTLPGFTSISMYPTLQMAGGLSYSELIDALIDEALARPVNAVR